MVVGAAVEVVVVVLAGTDLVVGAVVVVVDVVMAGVVVVVLAVAEAAASCLQVVIRSAQR